MNMISGLFDVVGMAGWVIGGFSMLVGGFGIANIMFVSVKERTSIIGLQKSLGAKNYFILFQFLFEAIFLSLIGGLVGLFFVYLITFIPLLGAIIVLLIPGSQEKLIKNFSIVISLVPLVLSLMLWSFYNDSGDYFAVEDFPWIPAIGVRYHMGVDGLSLPLVALTLIIFALGPLQPHPDFAPKGARSG